MKLTISNFRKFGPEPTVFEFNKGDVVLLRGKSGAGKTTILESLRWCLYGSMKNIYPNGITQKCYVQLEQSNINIYRQKNPGRLVVSYIDTKGTPQTYEDVIGQSIIDNMYGSKDVWISCSYISQKTRCLLLTMSQNDKIEVLNKLSFKGEDPRQYIDQISTRSKTLSDEHKLRTQMFTEECTKLGDDLKENMPDMSFYLDDANYQQLDKIIEDTKAEVDLFIEQQISQASLIGIHKTLITQESDLVNKLNEYAQYTQETLTELQTELDKAQTMDTLVKERDELLVQLNQLGYDENTTYENISNELQNITVTEDDYKNTYKAEGIRDDNRNRTKFLCIDYTKEAIEKTLSESLTKLKEQSALTDKIGEKQRWVYEHKKRLDEYVTRKNRYISEKLTDYRQRKAEINERYNADLQMYNQRKLVHSNDYNRRYNEFISRRDTFTAQQNRLISEYNDRKIKHNTLNDKLLNDYLSRKVRAESEHQRLINEYNNRKTTHENNQNSIITRYNERVAMLRKEYDSKLAEITRLTEKLNSFRGMPIYDEQQVTTQMIYIEKLKSYRDILECPHCHKGVRHSDNGSLVPSENPIVTLENDIATAENLLIEIKNGDFRLKEIKSVENELKSKQVPLWEEYVKILGDVPEYQAFSESPPQSSSFTEPEPEVIEFTETTPESKSFDESEPVNEPFTESAPQLPFIEEVTESTIIFEELAPVLELPIELQNIPEPMNQMDIDHIKRTVDSLQTITYYDLVIPSSAEIQALLKQRIKLIKAQSYLKSLISINDKIRSQPITETPILQLLKQVNDCKRFVDKREEWNNQLTDIKQKLSKIVIDEMLDEKTIAKKQSLVDRQTQKEKSAHARRIKEWQNKLTIDRQYLIDLHVKITATEKLRQTALNLETFFLESTIDTINQAIEQILPDIFDDPISVRINLFKESKSTKRTRICFNLQINHRGASYDSITQMSGGEGDRVSLAVILALNRINNSPFLLLDETISSLDSDLKEKCIKIIRESVIRDKSIITVAHDCVEGYYDKCVDV